MSDDETARRLKAMAAAEGVEVVPLRVSAGAAMFMRHAAAALTAEPAPKAVALVTLTEAGGGMAPSVARAATPPQMLGMAYALLVQAERDLASGEACDCAGCREAGAAIAAGLAAVAPVVGLVPFGGESGRTH